MGLKFNITKEEEINEETISILFARWIAMNYSSSELNGVVGTWWIQANRHFMDVVLPNYKENGTFKGYKDFILEERRTGRDLSICIECGEPINFGRSKCTRCSQHDLPF